MNIVFLDYRIYSAFDKSALTQQNLIYYSDLKMNSIFLSSKIQSSSLNLPSGSTKVVDTISEEESFQAPRMAFRRIKSVGK